MSSALSCFKVILKVILINEERDEKWVNGYLRNFSSPA